MSENQSLPEGSEFDMTSTTFETNESETIAEVQKGGTALQSTLATTQIHYLSVNNDPQIIAEEAQSTENDQVEPIKFVDKMTSSQTHEDLPTFEPGRDHAAISTRWSRWLEVWELYLASKELDKIDYKKFSQRTTSKLETISDVHLELDVYHASGPAIIKDSMSCPGALHHGASRCMRLVPTQFFSEARGPPSTSVRVALHAVTAMLHCVSLFNKNLALKF